MFCREIPYQIQGVQKNRTEYADEWFEDNGARGDIIFHVNLWLCVLNTPILYTIERMDAHTPASDHPRDSFYDTARRILHLDQ